MDQQQQQPCNSSSTTLTAVIQLLPEVLSNDQDLQVLHCSIAPVCTAWQRATSTWPRCVDVTLEHRGMGVAAWQRKVASFAAWLTANAALVRSINVLEGCDADVTTTTHPASDPEAQQVLAAALSRALQAPAPAQLQLQTYRSDCMAGSPVLHALQGSRHLTALQLHLPQLQDLQVACMPKSKDLFSTFQCLSTSLKSLELVTWLPDALPPACVEHMAAITGLTSLHLGVPLSAAGMQSLQAAFARMPLQRLWLCCVHKVWLGLDLRPLSCLSELQLDLSRHGTSPSCWEQWDLNGIQLPTQLKVLACKTDYTSNMFPPCPPANVALGGATPAAAAADEATQEPRWLRNFMELQQLQAFSYTTPYGLSADAPAVAFLQQLPSLTDMSLKYRDVSCLWAYPAETKLWAQLKHLHRLDIWMGAVRRMSRSECCSLLQAIGAATSLTSLKMNICMLGPSHWLLARTRNRTDEDAGPENDHADDGVLDEQANPMPLDVFSHFTHLVALRELHLLLGPPAGTHLTAHAEMLPVLPGSAIVLTVLTCLTSLQLDDFRQAVDNAAVRGFASSLTRLESLDVRGCSINAAQLEPQLWRQLPRLTELLLPTGDDT